MADVVFEGDVSRGGFKTGMMDMVVEVREAMSAASAGCKPGLSVVEAGRVLPLGEVCPIGDVADCKSERRGFGVINVAGVAPGSGNKPDGGGGRGICSVSAWIGDEWATFCPSES